MGNPQPGKYRSNTKRSWAQYMFTVYVTQQLKHHWWHSVLMMHYMEASSMYLQRRITFQLLVQTHPVGFGLVYEEKVFYCHRIGTSQLNPSKFPVFLLLSWHFYIRGVKQILIFYLCKNRTFFSSICFLLSVYRQQNHKNNFSRHL